MLNKKGFTLVELLAVIVILGIILVIVVPKIIDVINNSRIESFKNSSKLIYSGVKNYFLEDAYNNNGSVSIINLGKNDEHMLEFSGEYPDAGRAIMDSENKIGMYIYNERLQICSIKDYGVDDIVFYSNVSKESCKNVISQPTYLEDVVEIGDYIYYDAGEWETTVSYSSIVDNDGMHGGYTSGNSRNQGLACDSGGSIVSDRVGWRVLDINEETGEISIIHVGTPECYYNGVASETSINNLKNYDYSYYVNSAYATSATIFTKEMAEHLINTIGTSSDPDVPIVSDDGFWNGGILDELMLAGARYYFPNSYDTSGRLFYVQSGGYVSGYRYIAYGIRPVVKLKPNQFVESGDGTNISKYVISNSESFIAQNTYEKNGLITGYWQNWNSSDSINLKLKDVPKDYDIVAISFGYTKTGSEKGIVDFELDSTLSSNLGGYSDTDLKNDIKTLQMRGQKVILSIGGAGNTILVDDSTSVNNFVDSTYSLIDSYGFDGIDINFEEGVSPGYLSDAILEISDLVGEDFVLTMAPQTVDFKVNSSGVVSGNYYELATELKSIITTVNMQMYNSGTQYGLDGNIYSEGTIDFCTALATILLENGLQPDQVGLGSIYNSSNGGYMAPEQFMKAYNSLSVGGLTENGSYVIPNAYGNIGGLMIWSINGDYSENNKFLNAYSLALQQ